MVSISGLFQTYTNQITRSNLHQQLRRTGELVFVFRSICSFISGYKIRRTEYPEVVVLSDDGTEWLITSLREENYRYVQGIGV